MMSAADPSTAIDGFRAALLSYVRGDHEPVASFFSTVEDVTLANPLGPPRLGGQRSTPGSWMAGRASERAGG